MVSVGEAGGWRDGWRGERHEDQAGARSASPEKSLCFRQHRFELQDLVLKTKLPLSPACFVLFFGSG